MGGVYSGAKGEQLLMSSHCSPDRWVSDSPVANNTVLCLTEGTVTAKVWTPSGPTPPRPPSLSAYRLLKSRMRKHAEIFITRLYCELRLTRPIGWPSGGVVVSSSPRHGLRVTLMTRTATRTIEGPNFCCHSTDTVAFQEYLQEIFYAQ